jgi:DNA-binding transcriptional regulator YiaG
MTNDETTPEARQLRMEIARRIRDFRKSLPDNNTQAQFAALLGTNQQRMSGYESGVRIPQDIIAGIVRMGCRFAWIGGQNV